MSGDTPAIDPARLKMLQRPFFDAFTPRFRGEIWENAAKIPMARGYSNDGKPFDIETACYLKPVMRAIKDPNIPVIGVLAAVQMLKTFGCIEEPVAYFIEHDPGDTTIYIGGDDSAKDQARSRLIPRLKSIPGVGNQMREVEARDRFDITTQEFYLPGMILRIWALNENTTQRITLRRVLISDAFLSKKSGLISQAIARTTQHITDRKVIVESQGGEDGDDFDVFWKTTSMQELHVICPICGKGQPFDFSRERPEDFIPTPPKNIPSLDHAAWIEKNRPALIAQRHSGFKRGPEELIRTDSGNYNESEILKETHYVCFHCGGIWNDTPVTRKLLDSTAYYASTNPSALSGNVGFSWPAWAGQRLAWGGEYIMLDYLRAKKVLADYGNIEKLKQWYQKRAAKAWNPQLTRPVIEVSPGSYDPNQVIPDESDRDMAIDCQQDQAHFDKTSQSITGWFWYIARVYDKFGNSKQLARGHAKSWDEWRAVQEFWKIPNDRVVIDIGQWPQQIMMEAATRREVKKIDKPTPPFYVKERTVTWYLLSGENKRIAFKHRDGQARPWSPIQPVSARVIDVDGKIKSVPLKKIRFDKMSFDLQLDAIRSGAPGMPKFEILDRKFLTPATAQKESGNLTYGKQLDAQYFVSEENKFKELRADDHYRWCETALLVRQAIDGKLGHLPVSEGKAE